MYNDILKILGVLLSSKGNEESWTTYINKHFPFIYRINHQTSPITIEYSGGIFYAQVTGDTWYGGWGVWSRSGATWI